MKSIALLLSAAVLSLAFSACQTPTTKPAGTAVTPPPAPVSNFTPIRIKAGLETEGLTDTKGVKWDADKFFEGGSTIDRNGQITITGTTTPEVYYAERYSMEYYSIPVPNGKYTLKLHFSEDYDGITGPNDRIFTYTVKDGDAASTKVIKEVKGFGPWKNSGAQYKAQVETIPVTVTSGKITITFTPEAENPQINAIEVLPG